MRYGVLGKSLPHTYSPRIHREFADYEYVVIEKDTDGVVDIFEKKDELQGFNVTIPYKKLAMSLCDEISEEVSKIGAVNTVVLQENGATKAITRTSTGSCTCSGEKASASRPNPA